MPPSVIQRTLAASALLLVAANAANAQTATQPAGATAAAPTPWAAMPVGKYHLDIPLPERMLPITITITDSSGVPAATLLPEGDSDALPVKVTLRNPELIITGAADKGPFEIVLLRNADELSGRWTYGGDAGKLTGKVEK
jgi:hypothetical protein